MRRMLLLVLAVLPCLLWAQPGSEKIDLSYYLPKGATYNSAIPKPAEVIGHEVGEWHVTHDKLVLYMKALAAANPQRIQLQVTGTTYEGREQLLLIFSHPANMGNLENIRQNHLKLSNPVESTNINTANMPVVICMGFTIHGNEPSGVNAALVMAYHLAAAQGDAIEKQLKESVILFDPCFNPDGMQRFSTWVNQHKSIIPVTDPNSREFSEVWPGGRYNHYWFDLNRDWLPAVHKESRNRLAYYHHWRPNILTDHHEMGGNSTFFFQPGVPSRVNPLTPEKNQQLTAAIGEYHAKYLNSIGSLYYTKEGFDDYYYGKGSTYPDVQGAVGILFEQGSSRGHAQETSNGILTFPFTIRNQFYTTLSTLDAGVSMRKDLLDYQRDFFIQAFNESRQAGVKGFVFGDKHNAYAGHELVEMLQRHRIDVAVLSKDWSDGKQSFAAGHAWYVPAEQAQYRLIRTIFEKQLEYKDSLFYDVTSWTVPLAMGLPYAEVTAAQARSISSAALPASQVRKGSYVSTPNAYAWLMDWRAQDAPAALYQLQQAGITTKVLTRPSSLKVAGTVRYYPAGTILISTQMQRLSHADIVHQLQQVAGRYQVSIEGIATGLATTGIDLGSNNAPTVGTPKVALLVGQGVSALDAGEVWHLLDQRMHMPVTHLEIGTFNRVDLKKYTTLIMVSGSMSGLNKDKLKAWIEDGGVLIACEDAVQWCSRNGITRIQYKRTPPPITDSTRMLPYAAKSEIDGAQRMTGAIFRAEMDTTHPLAFGYQQAYIDMFKTNNVFMQPSRNPFASPVRYGSNPLQSGFITRQNYDALKGTASVVVQSVGSGRVIHFADNPNFRAFWLGGMKMFMNAVFFGSTISGSSASAEEE